MKVLFKIALTFTLFITITSCQNTAPNPILENQFSTTDDTLHISTKTIKGSGLFELGAGTIIPLDTSETFANRVVYPKQVAQLKRYALQVDFLDPSSDYVEIMKGVQNDKAIVIVDANNNQDFTDDFIWRYEPIDWSKTADLITCHYTINHHGEKVRDSSWLLIGDSHGSFLLGKREYITANIQLDQTEYKIGIVDPWNPLSFTYSDRTEMALLSRQGIKRDSLSKSDLISLGEALPLNGQYYRFERISKLGDSVTLVKDPSFASRFGTQKGMIAPDFKVITMSGDTLTHAKLQDKPIVIANSCGCGGDQDSTQAYYDMEEALGNSIHILHVDSNIENTAVGIHIDSQNSFNKDFYTIYRKVYCSRLCYVIGTDKRILEKFTITDWKSILPKIQQAKTN